MKLIWFLERTGTLSLAGLRRARFAHFCSDKNKQTNKQTKTKKKRYTFILSTFVSVIFQFSSFRK